MTATPAAGRIVLVLLAGALLACLVIAQRASHVATDTYGPTDLIPDAQDGTWIIVDRRLVHLDQAGRTLDEIDVEVTGIPWPLAGATADGNGGLLIGSHQDGRVYRWPGRGSAQVLLDPARTASGPVFGDFHLVRDTTAHRLLISDTGHHRVLAFSEQGEFQQQAGGEDRRRSPYRFPNGWAVDAQGRVLLANTNHHSVVSLDEALLPREAVIDTEPLPVGCGLWPALLSADRHGLYVIWLQSGMTFGSVARYAADGAYRGLLDLDQQAQPTDVLARGAEVLVADQSENRYVVHRFASDGHALPEFGDQRFRDLLDSTLKRRHRAQNIADVSRASAAAAAIALLIVALYLRRRENRVAASNLALPPMPRDPSLLVLRSGGFRVLVVLTAWFAIYFAAFWLAIHVHVGYGFPGRVLSALVLFAVLLVAFLLHNLLARTLLRGPAFVAWGDYFAARFSRKWAPRFEAFFQPGESLRHVQLAGARLLVLTSHRLMLTGLTPEISSGPTWQCWWSQLQGPSNEPVGSWRRLFLPGVAYRVRFDAPAQRQPLRVAFFDPAVERRFLAAVEAARTAAAAVEVSPRTSAPPKARLGSALLLSALIPGLGQMHQRRPVYGVLFLSLAALMLLGGAVPWIAYLRRASEVRESLLWSTAARYAFIWVISLIDVALFARRSA